MQNMGSGLGELFRCARYCLIYALGAERAARDQQQRNRGWNAQLFAGCRARLGSVQISDLSAQWQTGYCCATEFRALERGRDLVGVESTELILKHRARISIIIT